MKKFISLFLSICLLTVCLVFNSTEAQASASYDKAYAAKTLAVKSSPGTSYKTLGKIKKGKVVKVYGGVPVGKDQDDWYSYQQFGFSKIKYKNKYAYVKTDDLKFAKPFNWAPGVKSAVMKSVKKNQYVTKRDKIKLVKMAGTGKKGSPGMYIMYIKMDGKGEWMSLINIDCKTGWYHG